MEKGNVPFSGLARILHLTPSVVEHNKLVPALVGAPASTRFLAR